MSTAGIRSNRGDVYQTLVAFDWALIVLSNEDFEWIEVDSISYPVDDVVVGKYDGTLIACQCKKNHPDFKAWTIADLADELDKAFILLADNKNVKIRFYSRNNFGDLAKLREHSTTQNDEASYQASLGKEQNIINTSLMTRISISKANLSSFDFLCRTNFVTTEDFDRMEESLHERLRNIASNPNLAFTALWARLDYLGARMSGNSACAAVQHRLTKSDLKLILKQSGATLVPPMSITEVRLAFSSISTIGRSWRQDIAGHRLHNPIVDEILTFIEAKKKSILLTGLPGSGKTCAMLTLQDELEKRAEIDPDIFPLFIQSREYAELATSEDRHALGLSTQWVEEAARLAEGAHVVVVIDSLDVLSIARDHGVLQYFLAQIDRLLFIPNITVITACRDFDRHYDRRIAERKWDCELKCHPLDWDVEIAPLLCELGITTANVDSITRDLIKNPRELALFVELAQQGGSFNVVTSQALAQRYLDTIVRANSELGDAAIQAIEVIASEMLKLRSLSVPYQRFTASQDTQRKLCSLNILQENSDGKLTFGHQTLLDVLVISGAMRSGITLNGFIQGLPPVPFVRPSIRSFVAQLVVGERREFRKQLRTVLTGKMAFHIRRVIAESYAEQIPLDEDWPLIRELREKHNEVFQVIYSLGGAIEWHNFWLKHLIPALKAQQDSDGMTRHFHRIAQWSNEDCAGTLNFWMETLSLEWINNKEVVERLAIYLNQINLKNISLVPPLLERLLNMPLPEHNFLGRSIANCLTAGVVDDTVLWRYIVDDVTDEDSANFKLNNKIRCQAHEFGDRHEQFIMQRMMRSNALLDLALASIENWSNTRASRYCETRIGYRQGFLSETSYGHIRNLGAIEHKDSLNIILEAIEASIINHAKIDSDWWVKNRERLCSSREGALLYFAILACTASPEKNIDLIENILLNKNILEFVLSYEIGTLINCAFFLMSASAQDSVIEKIINLWDEENNEEIDLQTLKARAKLIVTIPCYLRSYKAQNILDEYEDKQGVLSHEPDMRTPSGFVKPPFTFEIFLNSTNDGIFRLIKHYNGYSNRYGAEFLVGGESEVCWQLKEASSRNPSRFLNLLAFYWNEVPENFRNNILEGVATYLAYCYGNLKPNENWKSIEEPNPQLLASLIMDELEKHPEEWRHLRCTAKALEACSNVINDVENAKRLVILATDFLELHEINPLEGNSVGLLELGINMAKGDVTDALMILANNFLESDSNSIGFLLPTLREFANDKNPAIRALVLHRLPYLQSKSCELGWDLFNTVMQEATGLWKIAEPCLYYSYHNHFDIVEPILKRLLEQGMGDDLEIWGRISALSTMTQHIELSEFLKNLHTLNSADAWRGAANVWTSFENIRQHREHCFDGLNSGLHSDAKSALQVAEQMVHIFEDRSYAISIPVELLNHFFSVLETKFNHEISHHNFYGFHQWLNAVSQYDPELALAATEIYLKYLSPHERHLYDLNNNLTQLITRLFAEAEETEEADAGTMLQRVVVIQDLLLSLGVDGIVDWLKAAERP